MAGFVGEFYMIDPGDQASWPTDIRLEVERLAAICRSVHSNTRRTPSHELRLRTIDDALTAESAFRELLGSRLVLISHVTRLLPFEIENVQRHGLQVLTEEFRDERFRRVAQAYGEVVGRANIEALRDSGPLSWGGAHRNARLGKLYGVTPLRAAFESAGHGVRVFTEHWGGESIYWANETSDALRRTIDLLTTLSTPTIVEFGAPASTLNSWASIWKVFVGQLEGRYDPWHEFSLTESVPPERVAGVLSPQSQRWPA